jgi:hypothetical protein
MKRLLFIGCSLLLGAGCATAQQQTNISPHADSVLRSACDYLAHTHDFSFSAEIWREHVDEAGQKIQFSRTVEMDVKRPDGLRLKISSPASTRSYWYDGKTLTILDGKHNLYSTADMPDTLDKALDTAHDQFGIDLPLIDLAVSDPYKNATSKVQGGRYYGIAPVLGVPCHHLAFTQDNVDWQIWIEDGPQPFIRKFVITYKNDPDAPEFTALITRWNVTDRIADSDFVFERPMGAAKVQNLIETRLTGTTNLLPSSSTDK